MEQCWENPKQVIQINATTYKVIEVTPQDFCQYCANNASAKSLTIPQIIANIIWMKANNHTL